jgi:hypothetical protein
MPLIRAFDSTEDFEDKPVDSGLYDLRITSAKVKEAGDGAKRPGAKYVAIGLVVEGADGAATVFHNLNIPWTEESPGPNGEVDEPAAQRMMLRDLRRFLRAFGLPEDAPIEEDQIAETFVGMTGKCQLTKVEAKDRDGNKTGEFKNELRLPRLA